MFVYGFVDNIDYDLYNAISSMKSCNFILFTNNYSDYFKCENLCLIEGKNKFDYSNLELNYNLLSSELFNYFSLKEVEKMMIDYLKSYYKRVNRNIYHNLTHFSNKNN